MSWVLITCIVFGLSPGFPAFADASSARSPCRIRYGTDSSIAWVCRPLVKGETIESLFRDRWEDVLRFNRIDRRHAHPGVSLKIPERIEDIRDFTPLPRHYQPAESEPKLILVDLSEQFLGAYEYGRLVFSAPITTGARNDATPDGEFRITAYARYHRSSLYQIENSSEYYPLTYALRFHIDRDGVSYWIHGRDLPGYPASHGCIGLYDEDMQQAVYNDPATPELADARKLFEWVLSPLSDEGGLHELENGPRVLITGKAPGTRPPSRKADVLFPGAPAAALSE